MKPLNIWETDFRVILSQEGRDLLKKSLANQEGIKRVSKNAEVSLTIIYRLLSGKGSHNQSYKQLVDYLKIPNPEYYICGLTYNGSKQVYPYIKNPNPLLFRILCHVAGDGTIASKNTCRWLQKKQHSNTLNLIIHNQIGMNPSVTSNGPCNAVTISAYFTRLAKHMFEIKLKDLKDGTIIEKTIHLEKEYRLQFLTALIVDEGYIRYNKATSLIISQKDKKFMENVSLLLDSLSYEHSPIKKEIDKNGHEIHRINIYAKGVVKYAKDLEYQIQDLGELAGLWHKQDSLNNYLKSVNLNPKYSKIQKDFINERISFLLNQSPHINYAILKQDKELSPLLKCLSKKYLIEKFYEKVKNKEIIRIGKGTYMKNLNFK